MPTIAEARARLERMVAATVPPTLSSDEITDLLVIGRRASANGLSFEDDTPWVASMALAVGDYVVPTVRTGFRYLVTVSDGAAGLVEPTWPTTDGTTVTLDGITYSTDETGAWVPTYDLNAAAAEGWRWKAGKIANAFEASADQQTFKRDQQFEHCMKMAAMFEAKAAGGELFGSINPPAVGFGSMKLATTRRTLGTSLDGRPIIIEAPVEDEDQAVPWVANS